MDSHKTEEENTEIGPLTREVIILRLSQLEMYGNGLDLTGQNLSGVDLSNLDLSRANLSRANLGWADLSRANLNGADLSGANLGWISLVEADLQGANLRGTDLSGADLSGANLCEAEFGGAFIYGADFSRARITEEQRQLLETAQYVTLENIEIIATLTLPPTSVSHINPPQPKTPAKSRKAKSAQRFRLLQQPLAAHQLASLFSMLDAFYTKSWLMAQGRFAELIEYNRTRDPHYSREANLLINVLNRKTPLEIELRLDSTSKPEDIELEKLEELIAAAICAATQNLIESRSITEIAEELVVAFQPLAEISTRVMLTQVILPELYELAKTNLLEIVAEPDRSQRVSKKKPSLPD